MFCPRCGSSQNEDLKFCKACGANLYAVRQVVDSRETTEKFDWSKTWVAEMFQSEAEKKRRAAELERLRGITPEVKRYNEIKAGVITSSVGFALMIVLSVLMQGIILSGKVPADTAAILSHLWVAGVIPVFVGIALIINGLFVSKKLVEISRKAAEKDLNVLESKSPHYLHPADRTEFAPPAFSVTEESTKHLKGSTREP
jgi:hypothetical protein